MAEFRKMPASVTLSKDCVTLDSAELLALLGVSRHCLYFWRKNHNFPNYIRDGKRSYIITARLIEWLNDRGIKVIFEADEYD
jgi:predicted DNA-binding transcriptional regulator AlpA